MSTEAHEHADAPAADNPVVCDCGRVLAEVITPATVVVDGVEFQYRRQTDYLVCPDCLNAVSVSAEREKRGITPA